MNTYSIVIFVGSQAPSPWTSETLPVVLINPVAKECADLIYWADFHLKVDQASLTVMNDLAACLGLKKTNHIDLLEYIFGLRAFDAACKIMGLATKVFSYKPIDHKAISLNGVPENTQQLCRLVKDIFGTDAGNQQTDLLFPPTPQKGSVCLHKGWEDYSVSVCNPGQHKANSVFSGSLADAQKIKTAFMATDLYMDVSHPDFQTRKLSEEELRIIATGPVYTTHDGINYRVVLRKTTSGEEYLIQTQNMASGILTETLPYNANNFVEAVARFTSRILEKR